MSLSREKELIHKNNNYKERRRQSRERKLKDKKDNYELKVPPSRIEKPQRIKGKNLERWIREND